MNHLRANTMRERVWRLIRKLGNYTLSEVAALAEAGYANIAHYHQCLVAAGYVRQVGLRKQEGRAGKDKVWRLVRNTGPKPPIQKTLRFLFDPNVGEYWSADPALAAQAEAADAPPPPPELPEGVRRIRITVRPGSLLDRLGKEPRKCGSKS